MIAAPASLATAAKQPDDAILVLENITKIYPAVRANDDVSLEVRRGHIHAVLGENGAGKSTLMKIIYGVVAPDAGTIRWKGQPITIRSPAHARSLGIGMIFQHFVLFETMTVEENIALAIPGSRKALAAGIRDIGQRLSLEIDPEAPVHALSVGERQRVEIIRCLLQDPDLIILDEPTAVLPPSRIPALFATLRRLADEGRAILFISHKLEEIRALCHTASVMRGGRIVATVDPTRASADELARLMIGHSLPRAERESRVATGKPALVVDDLSYRPRDPFGVPLDRITLSVRPGQIVGIAGISGNGQSELMRLLSGETRLSPGESRRIRFNDVPIGALGPRERRRLGITFVPEDRQARGTVASLSLAMNTLLTAGDTDLAKRGLIRFDRLKKAASGIIAGYDVRCGGPSAPARSLSGGNLQKFIIGREVELGPKLLLVAQPTWGLDVGAAAFVRQKLLDIAAGGVAVLVVSDELDELFEISDRLHVMFRGSLSPAIATRETTRETVGLAMAGSFQALTPRLDTRQAAHA